MNTNREIYESMSLAYEQELAYNKQKLEQKMQKLKHDGYTNIPFAPRFMA